jgi:hypothetical protein
MVSVYPTWEKRKKTETLEAPPKTISLDHQTMEANRDIRKMTPF